MFQAYQADVLKEMDERTGLTPEAVKERRRATDLALRATKPMVALVVAERHLWLNLTIMSQVQGGDWFVTIDLKDAYFHIQVVQRHRRFLRFAFGGKAYQYKVLPFGLALAPRTFTKCMDAALAPLRLQGIRVLNYLDDWLILAHSRELVSRHRDIVLGHIHSLGLRMNAKKSVLLPSQRTVFLGVRLDSVQMQGRLDTRFNSLSGPL